jgi:uncharacterized protein YecT (DUF1311 family)
MRYLVLLILGLCSLPLTAQDSPEYKACSDNAMTQDLMDRCASEESYRVDQRLNAAYAKLLRARSKDQVAQKKLKACERAWLTYRDAYINAMYPAEHKQAAYGTMYPMEVDILYAKLTQEHIVELTKLANDSEQH